MGSTSHTGHSVLVAQHQTLLREVLVRMLSEQPDFDVPSQAGSAAEALRVVGDLRPSVALIDEHLSGPRTPALVEAIRARGSTRVVVLVGYATRQTVERMLAAGADAIASKTLSIQGVADTIRRVARPERDTTALPPSALA